MPSINSETAMTTKKPGGPKTRQKGGIGLEADAPAETNEWKTYRDPKHGFEIDIPENWVIYKEVAPALASVFFRLRYGWNPHVDVAFANGPDEIINVVVEIMNPEPTSNLTEQFFRLYAQNMNYTHCEYGRIVVVNKAHTWTRYVVKNQIWSKKYLIVLNGKGYAITASCNNKEMFLQSEEVWDAIAASLRMPHSSKR
jgi:hypothetical protein